MKQSYAYIISLSKYYWIEKRLFYSQSDTASNLRCSIKNLFDMREKGIINEYDDICYLNGGKEGCLNLFNKTTLLVESSNSLLNPYIEELITNVCGGSDENIEYLHKLILYKYTHINDYNIPALVFFGVGGSGKGSIVSLLTTIFGEENSLVNLGQREISSSFDTYKGFKLIVSFDEIITNNTHSDKAVLNKLKNIICAEKITVNEKGVKTYQTNNIALIIISSNSNKPIHLDDKDKGNRRFSIIKSISKLNNGKEINDVIKNRKIVSEYLAWLFCTYPEVSNMKQFFALDNKEKKELEELSQDEVNNFWEWFLENHSNILQYNKITVNDLYEYQSLFCDIFGIENYKEFIKYFSRNSKYPKIKIRIKGNNKTYYGYEIPESDIQLTINDVIDIFN